MFDAKSLLEALMRGAQPNQPMQQQAAPGGLGDILAQLGGQGGGGLADILGKVLQGGGQGQAAPSQANTSGGGGLGGLGDILGKLGGAGAGQAPAQGGAQGAGQSGGAGGGLGDILGQLQKQMGQGGAGQGGGSIIDILTQVLGQATSGVKEGAGRLDEMTGASQRAKDALGQATGKSPDEILAQVQEWAKNNQLGAGAAMGGLGGLVLGTKAGRSAAVGAAKLGALALIGGLAYKAYMNYSQGKPAIGSAPSALVTEPAPNGSGFEPQAISNESATLYLRAMIGAAAADGRIEEAEQKKILGSLGQAGLDDAAHSFLRQELDNPASPEDLAAACKTEAEALQVYTAARLAIDPAEDEENRQYLAALAQQLGIDEKLASHIEASARAAA